MNNRERDRDTGRAFLFEVVANPVTGEPFPANDNGEFGVAGALVAGQRVEPCIGWFVLQKYTPDYFVGIVADVINGKPVPRPVPEPLRRRITEGLHEIVYGENKKR